jgi:hypothetical protein
MGEVLGGHERLTGFVGKRGACVGHRFIAGAGFVLFPSIFDVLLNILLLSWFFMPLLG